MLTNNVYNSKTNTNKYCKQYYVQYYKQQYYQFRIIFTNINILIEQLSAISMQFEVWLREVDVQLKPKTH